MEIGERSAGRVPNLEGFIALDQLPRFRELMIGRASVEPLPTDLQRRLAVPLARVNDTIVEYPRKIAIALRTGEGSPPIGPVHVALEAYIAEVTKVRGK